MRTTYHSMTRRAWAPAASRRRLCDSYGDRALLQRRLLPVVCHRRDKARLEEQKTRCLEEAAAGAVLVSPPWRYRYRPKGEAITVAECKTMNCIAQALCRQKDDWWKTPINYTI